MDSQVRYPPPLPGTLDAPCFDGRNISDFLRLYNVMCRNYLLSAEERIAYLPDYCTDQHREVVRCLTLEIEMEGLGWEALVPRLNKTYCTDDYQQQTFSKEYLEAYKSIKCDIEYLRFNSLMFKVISEDLIKRELLSRDTQCQWFLEWLPNDEIVKECLRQVEFDMEGELAVDFDTLRTHALKAAEVQRYMTRLMQRKRDPDNALETLRRIESLRPPRERSFVCLDNPSIRTEESPLAKGENSTIKEGVEALSERLRAVESDISSLMDRRRDESNPLILTPLSAPTDPQAGSLSKTCSEQIPDPSNQKSQRFQQERRHQKEEQWNLRQEQLQDQQDQQDEPQQQDSQPEQQRQDPQQARVPLPSLQVPKQDHPIGKFPCNKCLYCYGPNHYRYNCPDFKDAESRGLVHVNSRNKVSLGPSGTKGPDIPLLPGRSQKQIVAEMSKKGNKTQGLSKTQETPQVRHRSSVSSSWRNGPDHQSEQQITLSPEVQTKDESEHDSDSEDENDAKDDAQPKDHHNDVVHAAGTESNNQQDIKSKSRKPAATTGSDTDFDLPSIFPCSNSSDHSPSPSNDNSQSNSNNASNSNSENENETEIEIENPEGLRSAEEAIQLMRTMETIGVEEFSERSKQRQGGPPPAPSSQSRTNSQGPSSEASTSTASGKDKKKKSERSKKRRDQIQRTVVNNGDEGIEPHIEF